MKVGLKDGRQAAVNDLSVLDAAIGQPIDTQFRRFVATNNGAKPESNSFSVDGVAHMGEVAEFIAVENILSERSYIHNISSQAYPVASSVGGNYVILDQDQSGNIFFWDHEIEGEIKKIADSFDEFLNMIEPFDPNSAKPELGQVKSAWIDPEFLKEFGG